MTVLSITSMDPVCSEMMFRCIYPNQSSKGVIKILQKQDTRKNNFCILRFCPTFSMLEV